MYILLGTIRVSSDVESAHIYNIIISAAVGTMRVYSDEVVFAQYCRTYLRFTKVDIHFFLLVYLFFIIITSRFFLFILRPIKLAYNIIFTRV